VTHTSQDYDTIERTLDRDYFMTAEQSKEFGLIDRVIYKRTDADIGPDTLKKSDD